ncbi:Nramp family divalent metal transporter [Catalinimonas niigatensis]|uniref:Nramp family divalent metal transporter n=1 Tax=Catalinimonas niigatensis TaxID=1397264 RepID=UPI0026656FBB|nr:Nramp family divalent metal transporter [Catalinimonas niigatensis]WPP50969.1 Nramp family divalent metal transporter [Catalinimonas niigatensis]
MKHFFRYLGPGIITAALVFGPGSLTITSKLGSLYAYDHVWVIVIAIFFMVIFTEMGARIGIATNSSLLNIIKEKWGKVPSILLGIGIFAITASFQAGNTVGASLAFSELFHTDVEPWVIAFTLMGISLLFFSSFYKVLEKVMIALVGLMLLSFLITLLLAKPDGGALAAGIVPSLPSGSEVLTIALIASSFSVVGAFYQGYLVKEKGWKKNEIRQGKREAIAGVMVLGMISLFILVNAAAILYPKGIQVNSATDMGLALEPLYGNTATVIFMLGLFGASFSSLIGNATIGGSLLSDAFSLGNQLKSAKVRIMIMLVMVIGAAIALRFGRLPLELIVFAQAITIIIAPLVGIALLSLANDKARMGDLKNNLWKNIGGITGLILLLFLSASQVYLQFIR